MATVLLGYLSADKIITSRLSDANKTTRLHRLFHESMRIIMDPLIEAGKHGVEMVDGRGYVRKVHPILACYAADYPEQCLVTTAKYNTCPKCQTTLDEFGNGKLGTERTAEDTLHIIEEALNHPRKTFKTVCRDPENNLSGHIPDPFWSELPFVNIHTSITPDILHQVNGGAFSHLVRWCEMIVMGSTERIDAHVQRLPPSHGVRIFSKGFSVLMRKSGKEWKHMAKVLLGSILAITPQKVIKAARSLLDFIYLAQYASHDDATLKYMEDALNDFHKQKSVFQQLWPQVNFNFPKLHSLLHFTKSIRLFGATDNYNTEQFERLHKDFAKDAYRATNKKEERPQMIAWLERIEQLHLFRQIIDWRRSHILHQALHSQVSHSASGDILLLAKHAPYPRRDLNVISDLHKAPDFIRSLKQFLITQKLERQAQHRLTGTTEDTALPFSTLSVWTKVRMSLPDVQELDTTKEICDSFYAHPVKDRFDTVVVQISNNDDGENYGMQGTGFLFLFLI